MEEWVEGSFEVWSPDGSRTVHGVVLAAFGIHHDSERNPPGWVVAHIKTRLYGSATMTRPALRLYTTIMRYLIARPVAAAHRRPGRQSRRPGPCEGHRIEIAGQRIRLHGIDAPERRQTCRQNVVASIDMPA